MNRVVLLDTGPLSLVTNPKNSPLSVACTQWLLSLVETGTRIIIPEISDYELRRELLRANKTKGIAKLDSLESVLEYQPITTSAMRQAAILWAQARQQGKPTANDKNIDGDMILAGQAISLNVTNFIVTTTNVKHISRFVPADLWQNITNS